MTTQTEIEADELASKRNSIALGVMKGIDDLLASYDPENVLPPGVVGDMVWEVEELLIDASYEIEDLVDDVATLATEGDDIVATVAITVPATDGQGWELPGEDEATLADFSEDFEATGSEDSDESVEDPGSAVGA